MTNRLVHLALLVRDYDEAIDFFTRAFDWVVLEDEPRRADAQRKGPDDRSPGPCIELISRV